MMKKQTVGLFMCKTATTFLAVMLLLLACLASQSVKAQADQTDTQARNLGLDSQTAILQILDYGTISVVKGGQPKYLRNQSYVGLSPVWENGYIVDVVKKYTGWTQVEGSADNWNIKFVWPADGIPTLTLKNVKMDNVDSTGNSFCVATVNSSTGKTEYLRKPTLTGIAPALGSQNISFSLKIILQGDNWIETNEAIIRGVPVAGNGLYDLTIQGENGGKLTGISQGGISNGKNSLTVENAVLDISIEGNGNLLSIPLWTEQGDITIKNSTVTARNNKSIAIAATSKGNITIENSTVDVSGKMTTDKGKELEYGTIHAPRGNVAIMNSKINVEAVNNTGIRARDLASITESHLQIKAAGYGICARYIDGFSSRNDTDGEIRIGGGSLFITARSGAFWNAPRISLKGLAGEAEDEAAPYDADRYQAKWLQMYDDTMQAPERIVVSYKESDVVALDKYAVVTSNVADVWSKPYATEGSNRVRTEKQDAVLTLIGKVTNSAGSLWYQLSDGNWVHSGNLRTTFYKPEEVKTPKLGYVVLRWGTYSWTIPDKINGTESRAIAKGAKLGVDEIKEGHITWYRLTDGEWIDADAVEKRLELPATVPSTQPTAENATQQSTKAPATVLTTVPTTAPATVLTTVPTTAPTTATTKTSTTKPVDVTVTEVPATEVTQVTATEATTTTRVTTATEVTAQPTQSPEQEPTKTETPEKEKKGGGIKWVIVTVVVIVLIGAGDAAFIIIKKKKK